MKTPIRMKRPIALPGPATTALARGDQPNLTVPTLAAASQRVARFSRVTRVRPVRRAYAVESADCLPGMAAACYVAHCPESLDGGPAGKVSIRV